MMKTSILLAIVCVASVVVCCQAQHSTGDCSLVQQALDESRRIKPGMTRKDVEKHFKYDGGLQSPNQARFIHPACGYIKVEVAFAASPERGGSFTSANDTVTKVSKLYIDYPIMD